MKRKNAQRRGLSADQKGYWNPQKGTEGIEISDERYGTIKGKKIRLKYIPGDTDVIENYPFTMDEYRLDDKLEVLILDVFVFFLFLNLLKYFI